MNQREEEALLWDGKLSYSKHSKQENEKRKPANFWFVASKIKSGITVIEVGQTVTWSKSGFFIHFSCPSSSRLHSEATGWKPAVQTSAKLGKRHLSVLGLLHHWGGSYTRPSCSPARIKSPERDHCPVCWMDGERRLTGRKKREKKNPKQNNDWAFATKRRHLALLAVECLLFPVPVSNGGF